MSNPPDSIELTVWVKRGISLIRRDALDITDKDHPSQVITSMGFNPEDYGYPIITTNNTRQCPHCGELL